MRRWLRRYEQRRQQQSEAGFTLIEVIVTVAISSAIVVPILTWIIIGFRVENNAVQGAKVSLSSSLLNAYFSSDIANSNSGDNVTPTDCPAGDIDGVPILSLVTQDAAGTDETRTVYVVWSEDEPGGEPFGLWRRQCDIPSGTLTSEIKVIEELEPVAWDTLVTCGAGPAAAPQPCMDVSFSAETLAPNSKTLTARGVRRVGVTP